MMQRNLFGLCMFLAAFALFLSPVLAVQSSNITVDTNISADTTGTLLNITVNASHTALGEVNATTGFANYTIYNSTGSIALGPNLPMSFNGTEWINTSIDISSFPLGDYYVKVNATYASTSEWNWSFATKYFAVGAITKTRNNENYRNASTTVLNYTSMHGSEIVDDTKGNISYEVIGQAISCSLPWDGNFWTDIVDFSALGINSYTLQINATHYNLLNSTNYPFSISNYSGFVEDAFAVASNNDLDAAQIVLTQSGNAAATTDSNGFYSMKIMRFGALTPTMQAAKPGFAANTTNDYSKILLSGNSTLNGTVTEFGEGPISGANVFVYDNTTDALRYQTTTDANGHYSITVRGDKAYFVNYTVAGFPEQSENNSGSGFVGTNTVDVSLVADGFAYYNITIRDSVNTRPIPNVAITLYITEYENTKTTDANGNVIIKVRGSGIFDSVNYYANITHPDYENEYEIEFGGDINNGETKTKSFTLSGATYFSGYVIDEYNQKAVAGVGVNLTCVDGSSLLGYGGYYYNTTTNSGGWFRIDIPTSLLNLDSALNFTLSGYSIKNIPVYGNTSQSWTGDDKVKLRGTSKVEGKVVDGQNTNYEVIGAFAEIYIGGSEEYTVYTNDTGEFLLYVDGDANYTLSIRSSGYYWFGNVNVQNSSINYGTINLIGMGIIQGNVYDTYNNSIKLAGATITVSGGSGQPAYFAATNSNGDYSLIVRSYVSYNIDVDKEGYTSDTVSAYLFAGEVETENFGLYGKNRIYGYLTDSVNGGYIESATITITDTTNNGIYTAQTNSYGSFGYVYIPSTANYSISFEKDGYLPKAGCGGGSCGPHDGYTSFTRNLTGATHIEGSVMDEYNQILLEGVQITFKNMPETKTYTTTTDSDGKYSIDVGFDSNYKITYSKSGYNTLEDTFYGGGYPYDFGNLGNNDLVGKTTYLRGSEIVNVTVLDEFTQTPVIGAAVTIKPESGTSYSSNADIYGNSIIYIDGALGTYGLEIASYGYPLKTIADLAGSQIRTEELSATAKVKAVDIMAYGAYQNLTGASVILFYNYLITSFNYTLNETVVGVTAGCEGIQRDNIIIELTGTNVSYYDQKQLTSGSDTATFNKVPVGGYNITLNNTEYGCGFDVQSVVIPVGGTTYNFTYDIDKTEASFSVESVFYGNAISGAIVALSTDSNINCTTDVTGTCTIDFVPQGTRVFAITHQNYNKETTTKSISPGMLNNFTAAPVVLQPYPGNLTILVRNTTLQGINNVNVTISNESSTASILSDANGYANFTEMVSFQNITVNGTAVGYGIDNDNNVYAASNTTTSRTITLNPTKLIITVLNASAINDSNVTLWNGTDIAKSANGSLLTGRTNESGQITFSYVKAGDYNLTINHTTYSYFGSENVSYGFAQQTMDVTYYLNETYIDVYVIDPKGNPLSGINVSINTTGTPSALTDANGFMSTRSIDSLSEGLSINVTVNGTTTGYNYTNVTVHTINGSNPQFVTLYPNTLEVTVKNTTGAFIEGAEITIAPTGQAKYTDVNGKALFSPLVAGDYNVSVNGSSVGYNKTNETNIAVSGAINKQYELSDNFVVANITDEFGAVVEDGVIVTWETQANTTVGGESTIHYVYGGQQAFTVDGEAKGYGIAANQTTVLLDSQTTVNLAVNITRIKIYAYNDTGAVEGATVSVLNTARTAVQTNGEGQYMNGSTDAGGWIVFEYAPKEKYFINITAPNGKTNIAVMDIASGENNTASLYLKPVNTGGSGAISVNVTDNLGSAIEGVNISIEPESITTTLKIGETVNFGGSVVEITAISSTAISVKIGTTTKILSEGEEEEIGSTGIKVKVEGIIYDDDSAKRKARIKISMLTGSYVVAATETTNSTGIALLDIDAGIYNFIIDGEATGYGKYIEYYMPIGRFTFNEGTTSNGVAAFGVKGTGDYYVKITAPGYNAWNSESLGISFNGTHNSELSDGEYMGVFGDIAVDFIGNTKINGTVYDKYFISSPMPGPAGTLENTELKFYTSPTYMPTSLRYETTTDENGTYTINISSIAFGGSTTSQTYYVTANDVGYNIGQWSFIGLNENESKIITHPMIGSRVLDGSIYSFKTGNIITTPATIILSVFDQEICGSSSECNAYTNSIPVTNGQFSFSVREGNTYNVTINSTNYNILKINEQADNKYYLYPIGNSKFVLNINSSDGAVSNQELLLNNNENTTFVKHTTSVSGNITQWRYIGVPKSLNFTINGSAYGYGITTVGGGTYSSGNTYILPPVWLNTTYANISVLSDSGTPLDDVLINFSGVEFLNTTVNGSAVFKKVPTGTYSMTFTGIDPWYAVSGGTPQLLVSNAGGWNNAVYTVNETQFEIRTENTTSALIANVSLTLTGPEVRQNFTHPGTALFEKMLPGNYTVSFDETEFYDSGYYPPTGVVEIEAIGGNDAATGNNRTIIFNSTEGLGFAKITTLAGASATLYYNGTTVVDTEVVGSKGFVLLEANISQYNDTLTVTVSKSGYYTKTIPSFNLTSKEVKKYTVSLTSITYIGGGGDDSPGGSSTGSFIPVGIAPIMPTPVISPDFTAADINVYLNANMCSQAYVEITNTGNVILNNISSENTSISEDIESKPFQGINTLDISKKAYLSIEVCAGKYAFSGTYTKNIVIESDKAKTITPLTVFVQKDYSEILEEQLLALLETIYSINAETFDSTQKEYYENAKKSSLEAKDAISKREFERAETAISNIRFALSKINQKEPIEEKSTIADYLLSYGLWLLVPALFVVLAAIFLAVRGNKKEKPETCTFELPELPPETALKKPVLPEHVKKGIAEKNPKITEFNVFHAVPVERAEKFLTDTIERVVEEKCSKCGGKIFKGTCIWCGYTSA